NRIALDKSGNDSWRELIAAAERDQRVQSWNVIVLAVILFRERRLDVPSQAQVDGQISVDLPVVLKERPDALLVEFAPLICRPACTVIGKTQQEIGERVPGVTACEIEDPETVRVDTAPIALITVVVTSDFHLMSAANVQ